MSQPASQKLRVASVGLGNWAGRTADLLLQQHQLPASSIDLACIVEPAQNFHTGKIQSLKQPGIQVVSELDAALGDESIEAVILPVPIHLHRPFTERALAAGKAVFVEKPAAACVQDVDAMIAARDRAGLPVLVAYQDVYDPTWLQLKRAILAGEIGEITFASLLACWPRDEAYYTRTGWAGKLTYAGQWVLDSPLTNACAHYLNLILFLLGDREREWGEPTFVEAELYRAYDIENYDTISQRLTVSGISALVHLTHACERTVGPIMQVQGTRGHIRVDMSTRCAKVENAHGSHHLRLCSDARVAALEAFAAHVQHRRTDSVLATLEAARTHAIAANGASQCALVRPIDSDFVESHVSTNGIRNLQIRGIEKTMQLCTDRQQMLHESRLADWSFRPGQLSLIGYTHFKGCPSQSTFVSSGPVSTRHGQDKTEVRS